MVKLNINDRELYCDGYLKSNLDVFKERMKHDWDSWIVISGDEGDGKSVFAKQLCSIVTNGKFTVDDIAWTPKQFQDKVLKAEKYSAVLYDEAISGLSARRAMSGINNALISMAAQCRKRNLFVVIVLPSFFDLDKNIAIHRTRGLFHIYSDQVERGFFQYYNKSQKVYLYVNGKKFYNMAVGKATFRGRFGKWSLIDEREYERRKDLALAEQTQNEEKVSKKSIQRDAAMYILNVLIGWHQTKISLYIEKLTGQPMDQSTISRIVAKFKPKEVPELIMPK